MAKKVFPNGYPQILKAVPRSTLVLNLSLLTLKHNKDRKTQLFFITTDTSSLASLHRMGSLGEEM